MQPAANAALAPEDHGHKEHGDHEKPWFAWKTAAAEAAAAWVYCFKERLHLDVESGRCEECEEVEDSAESVAPEVGDLVGLAVLAAGARRQAASGDHDHDDRDGDKKRCRYMLRAHLHAAGRQV